MSRRDDCEKTREGFSSYIDNRLDVQEQQRLEHHLRTCPDCRSELESLRLTIGLLRRVPSVPPPKSFALPIATMPIRRIVLATRVFGLAAACAALLLVTVVGAETFVEWGRSTQSLGPMVAAPSRDADRGVVPAGTAVGQERQGNIMAAPAPALGAGAAQTEATPQATSGSRAAAAPGSPSATAGEAGSFGNAKQVAPGSPTLGQVAQTSKPLGVTQATPESNATDLSEQPTNSLSPWRVAEIGLGTIVLGLGLAWAVSRRRVRMN